MSRQHLYTYSLSLLMSCLVGPLGAQVTPVSVSKSTNKQELWLAQLGSESYEARESASRNLVKAGIASVETLARGVLSENAETAWRAGTALESIALAGDERTLSQVAATLDRLSQSKPGLKKLAQEIHARHKSYRHDKAVVAIHQHGGRLSGGYGYDAGAIAPADGPVLAGEVLVDLVDVDAPPAPLPDDVKIEDVKVEAVEAEAEAAPIADEPAPAVERVNGGAISSYTPDPSLAIPGKPAPAPAAEAASPAAAAPPVDYDPLAPPPDLPPEEPKAAADDATVLGGVVPRIIIAEEEEGLLGLDIGFPIGGAIGAVDQPELSASLTLDRNWRGGDDGLKVLKDLPEVSDLTLEGAALTDRALAHIAALPRLNRLYVRGGQFTSAGLTQLRAKQPSATVFAMGEAMLGIHADVNGGACVLTSVFAKSGAKEAGLQPGDKITKIDGQAVRDFSDLTIAVYPRKPGDKIRVAYDRAGTPHTADVVLKSRSVLEAASE